MFRFLTAGESHGPLMTTIIEGLPAGLTVVAADINADLARRQGGYGRGARQKIETDSVEITAGVRFGKTLGSPVTVWADADRATRTTCAANTCSHNSKTRACGLCGDAKV